MKGRLKRKVFPLLMAACVTMTAVPVSAASIPFTLRLEHGGLNDSPDSVKKILKNTDGDANFYVTVNSFNNSGNSSGKVLVYSKKVSNSRLSNTYLSATKKTEGKTYTRPYRWDSVPGNVYYRAHGEYAGGMVNIVSGNFTP